MLLSDWNTIVMHAEGSEWRRKVRLALGISRPRPTGDPAELRPIGITPVPGHAVVVVNADGLSADERRARVAALRGLTEAKHGRFDRAREAFSHALRLDPRLDLSRIPTFWKLPREAHEAAVDAYLDQERTGDAAHLRARLGHRFRPRLVR